MLAVSNRIARVKLHKNLAELAIRVMFEELARVKSEVDVLVSDPLLRCSYTWD